MSQQTTIGPEDALAAQQCGQAAQTSYQPNLPGLDEASAHQLRRFTQGNARFNRWATDPAAIQEWLMGTNLQMHLSGGTPAYPPRMTEVEGHWRPRNKPSWFRGSFEMNALENMTVNIEVTLPFLLKSHGVYEIVLFDLQRSSRVTRARWNDVVLLSIYLREAFHAATDCHTYVRYVAPIQRVERTVDVPPQQFSSLVQEILMRKALGNIHPGHQCNARDDDGHFRCPLRQEGTCNPTLP